MKAVSENLVINNIPAITQKGVYTIQIKSRNQTISKKLFRSIEPDQNRYRKPVFVSKPGAFSLRRHLCRLQKNVELKFNRKCTRPAKLTGFR